VTSSGSDADRDQVLRREELDPDPLRQFERWFADARAASIPLAEACAVATATADGSPSARMVLLKEADERGFVFATNYGSRKGRELADNPRASLLFYWHVLGRQVRVEGAVERVDAAESDAIWLARPRGSRLSALASSQSQPVASRDELEDRVAELERDLTGREVVRPEWWGGYRVVPDEVEFWQHRRDRLHHRFHYRRRGDEWTIEELQP
jgi:pyridoxamine 5'-phosphate oxidase